MADPAEQDKLRSTTALAMGDPANWPCSKAVAEIRASAWAYGRDDLADTARPEFIEGEA